MRKRKIFKILAIFMLLCVAFALTACQKSTDSSALEQDESQESEKDTSIETTEQGDSTGEIQQGNATQETKQESRYYEKMMTLEWDPGDGVPMKLDFTMGCLYVLSEDEMGNKSIENVVFEDDVVLYQGEKAITTLNQYPKFVVYNSSRAYQDFRVSTSKTVFQFQLTVDEKGNVDLVTTQISPKVD